MGKGKHQRIRDPLHNLVEFGEDHVQQALWKVIQTPEFQRLRRVRQLGFTELVYPGATHTRFSHSLGVYHIAKQLLTRIQEKVGKDFNSERGHQTLAAALLHDIGHGAFSHAFEEVGRAMGFTLAKHEELSAALVSQRSIRDILDNSITRGFSDNVARIISSSEPPRDIYEAVVSSQFDADRLDYMQRDRLMTGTMTGGSLDMTWLISNLEIQDIPWYTDDTNLGERSTFVLGTKAGFAAEAYILGLFQMYPTVYFHKATRGAEKIFTKMLLRLTELVRDGNLNLCGLPNNHPLVRFAGIDASSSQSPLDIALSLDDSVIMGALPLLCQAKDRQLADFAARLLRRQLYKCIDIRERLRQRQLQGHELEQAENGVRNCLTDWLKARPDRSYRLLLDEAKRSPYKRYSGDSQQQLNTIQILDASGAMHDIVEYSPVVAAIPEFHLFRAYTSESDREARQVIEKAIEEQAHA